ncbi:MAG: hypothetical protein HYZ34_06260 [Ignavibacteriae bacterium]|nr:hypothetical protein [Ignavibacteriota bacterium]
MKNLKLHIIFNTVIFLFVFSIAQSQEEQFDVDLMIDYTSAEECVRLFEDQFVNTEEIASLRGNRIATSTTGMIASKGIGAYLLKNNLDTLKHRLYFQTDVYNLEDAKRNAGAIREMLDALKRRNFNRKVVATVEQIFPHDVEVSTRIPVYVVALGHENVDAYVRRIAWRGDEPMFVGEDEGELTIVINLAQAVKYSDNLEERFIELLGVVAHEVFHAAFGVYKENSSTWKRYEKKHRQSIDVLLDLTHNEGIAYYLSLEQQGRGNLPRDWNSKMREVFITFNNNVKELLSPRTSGARLSELIRSANLSGFWESYGSMTGMYIARTIDKQLGRAALIETISNGPTDFFRKYIELTENDAAFPRLSQNLIKKINH